MFNTVGPRQTGRFGMVLPRFIAAAQQNEPLRVFGDGQQSRCFCYVLDTVEALIRLQNAPAARGEIFNIGNTEEVSIQELARRVIETLDSQSAIEFLPYAKAYAPGFDDMRRRKPMVEKLERMTGFRPRTSLREIIQRTAESIICP
jgi:UDP-glucose 4-epimerase